jgi:hypothetical protein
MTELAELAAREWRTMPIWPSPVEAAMQAANAHAMRVVLSQAKGMPRKPVIEGKEEVGQEKCGLARALGRLDWVTGFLMSNGPAGSGVLSLFHNEAEDTHDWKWCHAGNRLGDGAAKYLATQHMDWLYKSAGKW